MIINLTGEQSLVNAATPLIQQFYEQLPAATTSVPSTTLFTTWNAKKDELLSTLFPGKTIASHEGYAIPSMVNYVGFGGALFGPGDRVSGSTSVVTRYLSTGYMWDHVRVLGGAYGGFARFSESSGRFAYLSYRDPNLAKTLDVYHHAGEHLSETEVASEEILQAIIASIGDLDSPMSPDQQGFVSFSRYLGGVTLQDRQDYRDEILRTSPDDFKTLAAKLKKLREEGHVVVFGSQQALETANQELDAKWKMTVEPAFGNMSQNVAEEEGDEHEG